MAASVAGVAASSAFDPYAVASVATTAQAALDTRAKPSAPGALAAEDFHCNSAGADIVATANCSNGNSGEM